MRVLFLSTNTQLQAGVRYRLLQFFPFLQAQGITCEHEALFDERLDRIFYRSGHTWEKVARLGVGTLRRLAAAGRARRYDAVVLLREAHLLGPPLVERVIDALGCPIVLDLDDAVWEGYDSPTYGRAARIIKCAWKTNDTIRRATAITAGNRFVRDHVAELNPRVALLPTVVDLEQYRAVDPRPADHVPVLGWIGSHSTFQYLRPLLPTLDRLAERLRFVVRIVGAAAEIEPRPWLQNIAWSLEREIEEVRSFDVGLFPIVEDAWSRGKSGFKAVQYGAVGIPTVASPVTTNCDIVRDGETGLLADRPESWAEAIERLVGDTLARRRMGQAARARIAAHYSLRAHAPRFAELLSWVSSASAISDSTSLPPSIVSIG